MKKTKNNKRKNINKKISHVNSQHGAATRNPRNTSRRRNLADGLSRSLSLSPSSTGLGRASGNDEDKFIIEAYTNELERVANDTYVNHQLDITYQGQVRDGTMNGQGKMTLGRGYGRRRTIFRESPGNYEGNWKDGKPDGFGKGLYPNHDEYEGNWKDGKPDGMGTMTSLSVEEGTGIWRGVFFSQANTIGDRYEGNWKDGNPDGNGTITYQNGDVFEGRWETLSSGMYRTGRMTYSNGSGSVQGKWKNVQRRNSLEIIWNEKGDLVEIMEVEPPLPRAKSARKRR